MLAVDGVACAFTNKPAVTSLVDMLIDPASVVAPVPVIVPVPTHMGLGIALLKLVVAKGAVGVVVSELL